MTNYLISANEDQPEIPENIWVQAFVALRMLSRPVGGPSSTLREGSLALIEWLKSAPGGCPISYVEKNDPSRVVFSLDGWLVCTEEEIRRALEATDERLINIGRMGQDKLREALIICSKESRRWSSGLLITEHYALHTYCRYHGPIGCKTLDCF